VTVPNLAKAARVEIEGWIDIPAIESILAASRQMQLAPPSNPRELTDLLAMCVASGDTATAIAIAWDVAYHIDCDASLLDAVKDGLQSLPADLQGHLILLASHADSTSYSAKLNELLEAADDLSTRAAAILALDPRERDRREELAPHQQISR
jgi:hypothetical protein